jgi:alkylation response protein AidB-like acyl-CoA dehydrogenase
VQLSKQQKQFAEAIRDFSQGKCGTLAQRDAVTEGGTLSNSPQILAKFARLGWLGVSLPAAYGGGGGWRPPYHHAFPPFGHHEREVRMTVADPLDVEIADTLTQEPDGAARFSGLRSESCQGLHRPVN